jgi:hypothetical protein
MFRSKNLFRVINKNEDLLSRSDEETHRGAFVAGGIRFLFLSLSLARVEHIIKTILSE